MLALPAVGGAISGLHRQLGSRIWGSLTVGVAVHRQLGSGISGFTDSWGCREAALAREKRGPAPTFLKQSVLNRGSKTKKHTARLMTPSGSADFVHFEGPRARPRRSAVWAPGGDFTTAASQW